VIADASLAIRELEEEIRRDLDRRYAFYRMLRATDRVLWRLEQMNLDGIVELPLDVQQRMRASLADLPASCMEAYVVSARVQDVLDSVFEVQERLFCWANVERPDGEEGNGG
jgi:hypothetical protein